jgi:hypothetical protein
VQTLFAFLSAPDPVRWHHAATAAIAGLLKQPAAAHTGLNSTNFTERTVESLHGGPLVASPGDGRTLIRAVDASGCPVTVIVDARQGTGPLGRWSALAVIDDRPATIVADDKAHRRRWAAWLYWGNLVQFLAGSGGDGASLAVSALDDFDPATLVAAGGTGFLSSYGPPGGQGQSAGSQVERTSWAAGLAQGAVTPDASTADAGQVSPDAVWANTHYLAADVVGLAHDLARLGVPEPDAGTQIGYELGEQGWQAELAWPDRRVAVIAQEPAGEVANCIGAYTAAGWDARLARDWPPAELGRRIVDVRGGDR